MIALSAKIKQQVAKVSLFSIAFAFVKLNSFTAALFLSNFVASTTDYGLFEYALSLGLILAIPLDLGLQGAYPFFNLKLKKEGYRSIFFFHALLIGGGILLFVGGQELFAPILADKWNFALLLGGIFFSQSLLSVILKSHERIFTAILFDGGLFIILNFYNLYLYLSNAAFEFQTLNALFLVYLTILFFINVFHYKRTKADFRLANYKAAIQFGQSILVAAFLIIWLTGSARIFIEYFLNLELVGIYAFYFRLASVMIMLHQIINIVFFKKIYQAKPQDLDNWFVALIGLIFFVGLISYALMPLFLKDHFQLFNQTWDEYQPLFIILNFQMIFWIGMALYENILYREQLAIAMNKWFLLLIAAMAASFFLLNQWFQLDIFTLCLINAAILFLATEIQSFLLSKKAICFKKTKRMNRFLLCLLAFYLIILS
jgi:O-antigen/teichoic acid export membrane protein